MENRPGVLVVMAHPDDESMGCGGLILRHTRAGVPVHLVCATKGGEGWGGKPLGAKKEDLPQIRSHELEEAAAALALSSVELWDYPDGGVDKCDRQEMTQRIWEQISKKRPRAVVGWGPDGAYGHPDHIAIGACTDAAVNSITEGERPALYHIAVDEQVIEFYKEAVRLSGGTDSALPLVLGPRIDVIFDLDSDEVMMKLRAVDCHKSQLEDWRISIRDDPHLLKSGYGHEPYAAISSRVSGLTERGLLGEFASRPQSHRIVMINSSLKQLATMLASKEISSVEMTREFLQRIAQHNPEINAFITLDQDKTLAQAAAADQRIAQGNATPLTGIPIAQKDIFCAKGWKTTCGSKMLANFTAPYDAGVIERFDTAASTPGSKR